MVSSIELVILMSMDVAQVFLLRRQVVIVVQLLYLLYLLDGQYEDVY